MNHDTPTPDYDALIDAQFDGMLTEEQARELHGWLLASPENAVHFARRAQEHQHLRQVFSGERVSRLAGSIGSAKEDVFSIEQLALLDDHHDDTPLVDLTERLDRERRERHRPRPQARPAASATSNTGPRVIVIPKAVVWLGFAAVLGLALWIGTEVTPPAADPPSEVVEAPSAPAPAPTQAPIVQPAPTPPARLLATHQARWAPGSAPAAADGTLDTGAYRLDAGYAHIQMADGATVIVEGPATLTINSASRVALTAGVLSAYVPEGAEGFVVDTPAGRVLDLGTEFGVEVLADESVEVHVMTGRVVASLPGDGDSRPLRAGDAGRMDADAARIEPVVAQSTKFARDWEQVERSVRVSGAVRYLYDTPESVRPGALEDNHVLFLLPEQRDVRLDRDLACDFRDPGVHDRFRRAAARPTLPAGLRVDSYLLHYDRVGAPDALVAVRGVIHFDRPVVGIIVDDRLLAATDGLFLNRQAIYPAETNITRGLEGREHESNLDRLQDYVELSADRLTLRVNLETSTGIDQLRVLVEAGPPEAHTD